MDLPIEITPLWQGWGIWNAFKSFFHQVSSWDFSLLKWVLIAIPVIAVLLLIYFIISWKLRVVDNGDFWQWYWLRLITWSFWAGKTKNVFQSAFLRKKDNPDWIIISNLKYDFVDVYFDSKKDFDFILKDLVQYIRDTNKFDELKKSIEFPPIKLIVDEAHLYLFARDFKSFTKDILLVLTQCRKREISIDFITQELWQIDVFIRRLCPYIEYFEEKPLGLTKQTIFYSLDADNTSMRNEDSFEEVESSYLLPFSRGPFFKPSLKQYYEQKFLTKYVIWGIDVYSSTEDEESKVSYKYQEFKQLLDQKIKDYRTPPLPKKTIFDSLFKKSDPELDKKIIQQQKEVIKQLLKLIPMDQIPNIDLESVSPETKQEFIMGETENLNQ